MSRKQLDGASESQVSRFIETARALGCDESEAAFDKKLKVIARHKPAAEPKTPKPSRKET